MSGVCPEGFDGDAWMADAEGEQDDIKVGRALGVNDPGKAIFSLVTLRDELQSGALGERM